LRYLSKELSELKPWVPPHEAFYRIQSLLRRRASLVHTRVALTQSLGDVPELKNASKRLSNNIKDIERLIERCLKEAMAEVGWRPDAQRCKAIEGIGDLTSVALPTPSTEANSRAVTPSLPTWVWTSEYETQASRLAAGN